MTDYAEEQRNEIEALQAIYPDELTILETEPFHIFELSVASQSNATDVVNASCVLKFTYNATYPDVVPTIEINDLENIDDDDDFSNELYEYVIQLAEESVGMVMVFTIASAVQEKLTDCVERLAIEKRDAEIRKIRELEEAEQKRFEGTRVTIESFLEWQAKFDAEMLELKRLKCKEDSGPKKLTGKELFMLNNAMDDSDVKFLEVEGGEVVEVDESLFEDIDDLNLDDNLEEDDDDDINDAPKSAKNNLKAR